MQYLRVFLVEDFPNMRTLMGELFTSLGGIEMVGTAETEAEARLWLDEHRGQWDVAVVDLVLSQGSGFGVVQHANRAAEAGRIVVFSSYTSPTLKKHCMSLGACAVFDKAQTAEFASWIHDQSIAPECPA